MKFVYLKSNNPTNENVIGFSDKLPIEFGLHKYIDYDTIFDKTFEHPLHLILDNIGWKTKKTSGSLEDFFS